jgi:hypothetical protein
MPGWMKEGTHENPLGRVGLTKVTCIFKLLPQASLLVKFRLKVYSAKRSLKRHEKPFSNMLMFFIANCEDLALVFFSFNINKFLSLLKTIKNNAFCMQKAPIHVESAG